MSNLATITLSPDQIKERQRPGESVEVVIAGYERIWSEYVRALKTCQAALSEVDNQIRAEIMVMPPAMQKYGAPFWASDIDANEKALSAARGVLAALIRYAASRFAPEGVRLEIDSGPWMRAAGLDVWPADFNPESFDPVAVWRRLEEAYDGEKGGELAYKKAAFTIANEFSMAHHEPEYRRGKLVLTDRVTTEGWGGKRVVAIGADSGVARIFSALADFAVWAGSPYLASWLREEGPQWRFSSHREVISRERFVCGDLTYITYNNHFEYLLAAPLAEQLQQFIGLYGQAYFDKYRE